MDCISQVLALYAHKILCGICRRSADIVTHRGKKSHVRLESSLMLLKSLDILWRRALFWALIPDRTLTVHALQREPVHGLFLVQNGVPDDGVNTIIA